MSEHDSGSDAVHVCLQVRSQDVATVCSPIARVHKDRVARRGVMFATLLDVVVETTHSAARRIAVGSGSHHVSDGSPLLSCLGHGKDDEGVAMTISTLEEGYMPESNDATRPATVGAENQRSDAETSDVEQQEQGAFGLVKLGAGA